MVRQVVDFGQDLEAISAGGGLSIPYREGKRRLTPITITACGAPRAIKLPRIWAMP